MNDGTEGYIRDIITRMCDGGEPLEPGTDSSQSISWKAMREAENVDNQELVSPLVAYIEHENDKNKRDRGYFLLGHIAKNTGDAAALKYLLEQAGKETDKYVLSSLLDRIARIRKPPGTDLANLIAATKSDKWLVRHAAIQSLDNCVDAIAEKTLIAIVEESSDAQDVIYANAVLGNIGSREAIRYIERHLNSRKKDVRISAKIAIEAIEGRARLK